MPSCAQSRRRAASKNRRRRRSVLVALAALAAMLAAVFFVPVTILVTITKNEGDSAASTRLRLRWLVFSWSSKTSNTEGRRPGADVVKPSRRRRRRRRRAFGIRAALTSPGLLRRVLRFAAGMARWIRPDRVRLRGRVGFDDPADTGMVLGWLCALRTVAPEAHWLDARLQPEFGGEALAGRAVLRWSRSIASLLWLFVRFCASPVVWRAARAGFNDRF
jgi:hypothetical protein